MMVTFIPFMIRSIMCKIPPFECCHSQDTYNLCSLLLYLDYKFMCYFIVSLKG